MFTSNNVILYSLSRCVRDRFTAVASCYGIFCPLQSVGVIKSACTSGHHLQRHLTVSYALILCFCVFVFLCSVYCISYVGFSYRSLYGLCFMLLCHCILWLP